MPIVLPVDLLEFKAKPLTESSIRISFITVNEQNVKRFIVSKSLDGFNFMTLDNIYSNHTPEKSEYNTTDDVTGQKAEVLYYKLQEEDFNGKLKTIGYCIAELKPAKEIISTLINETIHLRMPVPAVEIQLISMSGYLVRNVPCNDNEVFYQMKVEDLASGFYFIRVTDIYGKTTVKKIVFGGL